MKGIETNEFFRKILHVSNVFIPLIHIHLIKDKMIMLIFLSIILVICFFIELIRAQNSVLSNVFKKYFFFMMRDSEKEGEITGATWVFVGSLLTIILVPKPFCLLALIFLAIGDTFAALVGISYPFFKIGSKTLSGSLACFFTCCMFGYAFNFEVELVVIIFGAFIATISELASSKINDNLSIPILSGLSMYLINILL